MPSTVLVIKDSSFKLAATEAAIAAAPDFTCQVQSAAVVANPSLQTVAATFCGPESQAPAATGWELDVTILQDWGDGSGQGLSEYLFDHDAEQAFFEIQPNDPAIMGMKGTCWLVAGNYLGDAGTPLTATAVFPCLDKPQKVPTGAAPPLTNTATAGTPGSFSGTVPADFAALGTSGAVASPTTAWTTGQYVALGDASSASWDGTAWQPTVAP